MPASTLPVWVAGSCGVAFVLGIYGLGRAIGWATRLFDQSANAFAFPAALVTFRFTLTAAISYELVCTRPSRWSN